MRAALIEAPGKVTVTTVPDPTPGPRDVVVEVAACGLCGTDLHILQGEFAPTLPVVPGHEFAGEVVAVGADVTEVAVGDRVAVDPSLYCHECRYCREGHGNLCARWGAIGVTVPGGAAEYAVAPVANCVKLPEHVDVRDAALIEPLSCAVRGYDVLGSRLGAEVLIYGSGTMGLMMLELAKRTGAVRVDVVDVNPARLETARRLGAEVLIYGSGTMGLMMLELAKRTGAVRVDVVDVNPRRLETARLLGCSGAATSADEFGRPGGWDVVVDATGNAAAIQDGLGRVAKAGTFLQFGVADYATRVEIDPYRIYNQEITITGSMAVLHSYERAAELFAAGVLDAGVFISHRMKLDEYPDALARFRAGEGRKIVVEP